MINLIEIIWPEIVLPGQKISIGTNNHPAFCLSSTHLLIKKSQTLILFLLLNTQLVNYMKQIISFLSFLFNKKTKNTSKPRVFLL
jgi:hypothetical protein